MLTATLRQCRRAVDLEGSEGTSSPSSWVWVLAAAGYAQGSTFLLVGLAGGVLPGARGLLGGDFVSGDLHHPLGVGLTLLAIVSWLACVFIVLGQGHALTALMACGAFGTVALTSTGSWAALVVPAAMVWALLVAFLTPAFDYLFSRSDDQR